MDFEAILQLGAKKGIIIDVQRKELLQLLYECGEETKQIPVVVKIVYYLGGFIMLTAMVVLMSHTIQHSSYYVILAIGVLYSVLFLNTGEFLWRRNEKTPAGILYFLFIASFSLIVMDIEKMIGFFPHFSDIGKYSNYFAMCCFPTIILSVIIIVVNTILQKYRNISLLSIPTIVSSFLIYMTFIYHFINDKYWTIELFTNLFLIFSVVLVIIAFIKDKSARADYSKWMYLFGSLGIFYSMISIFNNYWIIPSSKNGHFVQLDILIISLIYLFIGSLIQRKSFSIIGVLGIVEYIFYLEFHYIVGKPILLTSSILITGFIMLYLGVLANKNSEKIISFLESLLPSKVRNYLPKNRK